MTILIVVLLFNLNVLGYRIIRRLDAIKDATSSRSRVTAAEGAVRGTARVPAQRDPVSEHIQPVR